MCAYRMRENETASACQLDAVGSSSLLHAYLFHTAYNDPLLAIVVERPRLVTLAVYCAPL